MTGRQRPLPLPAITLTPNIPILAALADTLTGGEVIVKKEYLLNWLASVKHYVYASAAGLLFRDMRTALLVSQFGSDTSPSLVDETTGAATTAYAAATEALALLDSLREKNGARDRLVDTVTGAITSQIAYVESLPHVRDDEHFAAMRTSNALERDKALAALPELLKTCSTAAKSCAARKHLKETMRHLLSRDRCNPNIKPSPLPAGTRIETFLDVPPSMLKSPLQLSTLTTQYAAYVACWKQPAQALSPPGIHRFFSAMPASTCLAEAAHYNLRRPITNAAVERLFSLEGIVGSSPRRRMNESSLEHVLTLQFNRQLVDTELLQPAAQRYAAAAAYRPSAVAATAAAAAAKAELASRFEAVSRPLVTQPQPAARMDSDDVDAVVAAWTARQPLPRGDDTGSAASASTSASALSAGVAAASASATATGAGAGSGVRRLRKAEPAKHSENDAEGQSC